MSAKFEIIPFSDHQIMTARDGDGIHVVMKPITEALGLAWNAQLERIKRHPVLAEGMRVTRIPSAGGMQEAVTLELERFHGWLVTISPERIADDGKRAVIIDYQRRAFRVIYEHFHGPMAPAEPAYSPVRDLIALQNQAMRLAGRLQRTANAAERRMIHSMLGSICQQVGVETPPLDQLGHDAPTPLDIVAEFWAAVRTVERNGVEVNHSRTGGLIALSLPELKEHFRSAGITLPIDRSTKEALRLSSDPAFIAAKAVNSRLSPKGKRCWVFRRDAVLQLTS